MLLGTTAAAALIFVLAAGPAAAQIDRAAMLERLEALDMNGDGAITKDEARQARTAAFESIDANGDGLVDESERRQEADRRAGRAMAQADSNSDGRLSLAEFLNAPYPIFERLDANGDQVISSAELNAARARLAR